MQSRAPLAPVFEQLEGRRGWRIIVDFDKLPTRLGQPSETPQAACWGELLRADVLARELGADRADHHDARLVLAGYQRWGSGLFTRLLGEVACGVWEPSGGRLVAATDPFGSRPLYYAQLGSRIAVSTDTRALWSLPWVGDAEDERTVVAWLINATPDDDATFYRNIRRLPGGHVLVAEAGRVAVHRYWGPEFPTVTKVSSRSEFEGRFRDVLFDAVLARIEGFQPVSLQLSGGFDSTSIAAAAGELARRGVPGLPEIRTLSAVFPGLACDESSRIEAVRSTLPFAGDRFEPEGRGLTIDNMRSDVSTYDAPLVFPQRDLFDAALARARASGASAVVTGHGGDELAIDWDDPVEFLLANGFAGLPRSFRRLARAEGGLLQGARWLLAQNPPNWTRRAFWRARLGMGSAPFAHILDRRWWSLARELLAPPPPRDVGFDLRADEERWWQLNNAVAQRSRAWVAAAGDRAEVALRTPFLDRRLAELVFATPPHLRPRTADTGVFKPLIVSATGHLLPAGITQGRWKVDFADYQRRVVERTRAGVESWLSDPAVWASERYVERSRAVELTRHTGLTHPQGVANTDGAWFRVLGVEHWLTVRREHNGR